MVFNPHWGQSRKMEFSVISRLVVLDASNYATAKAQEADAFVNRGIQVRLVSLATSGGSWQGEENR
jgi:hypothetical protein